MITEHRLHRFFNPRSIAMVGASGDTEIIRGRFVVSIVEGGFSGDLYAVTRSHETIHGLKCYSKVADLPVTPDLAVIMVPASVVAQLLEECGQKGIKAALILSSGFNEQGDRQGESRQRKLREIAAAYSMTVCGPNAEGFFNPAAALTATFSPALRGRGKPTSLTSSGVGIVSQSGGVGFAIFNRGLEKGLEASYVVSTGNEVDVDATSVVDYFLNDAHTSVAALFVEGLKDVSGFIDVAKSAAKKRKPLVMAKVGRSAAGQRASLSHTATLTGQYSVYESVLGEHGVTFADDLEQLIDVSHAFSKYTERPAKGRRVGILTSSGGAGIWMADACAEAGLDVCELDDLTRASLRTMMPAYGNDLNPVDITAQGVYSFGFSTPLQTLVESPSVDMVIIVSSAIVATIIERDLDALRAIVAGADKPIMFCAYTKIHPDVVRYLTESGIPVTNSMPNAAKALADWAKYSAYLDQSAPRHRLPKHCVDQRLVQALTSSEEVLCEYHAGRILQMAGIDISAGWLATTESEAVDAYRCADRAVALKVQSSQLVHKSDAGAVRLDLNDEKSVAEAFKEVIGNAITRIPRDEIAGVLVQPMALEGTELIVGIDTDPDFGPILMLGLGGVWVELLQDVQIAAVPVSETKARSMLSRLKGEALLRGARGRPEADIDALVHLIVALSMFADRYREQIREVDLNPVIVHAKGQGLTIADALIVKHKP